MPDMDISHIRQIDGTLLLVFQELLRERRATAAAARLGLTQSGISHALNRLRLLFGDELFLRRPHGLEPTARALELGPRIEALVGLANETLAGTSRFEPAASQRQFRIGGPDFMTALIAPQLVQRIKREAPGASVSFVLALGGAALDLVRRGEIDIAIGRLRKPLPPLEQVRLFRDTYAVAGRAGHPALKRKLTERSYSALPQVFVATTVREPPPRENTYAVVPHFMAAFAIVAHTDAVVVAPRPLAERYAKAFGLSVVVTPVAVPVLDISMVRRMGAMPDTATAWLAQVVREVAREAVG
jgi:DNA-binding transcriptional LysR family regulator